MVGECLSNFSNKGNHTDHESFSAPYAIVDDQNRVIVMLCGRPRDGGWDAVVREMTRVLLKGGQEANLKLKDLSHRRGYYPALSSGVSYGGGQTVSILFAILCFID
jgi:hypothetical protein